MNLSRYMARLPPSRFQWLHLNRDGTMCCETPPEDWGMVNGEPTLTEEYYIAAPVAGISSEWNDQPWEAGTPVQAEFDLYVRFASSHRTPRSILNLANTFGLLCKPTTTMENHHQHWLAIKWSGSPHFVIEPAAEWISAIGSLNYLIRKGSNGALAETKFLNWYNSWHGEGVLDFRLGEGGSYDVVASTLSDLLRIQWGIANSRNVVHRQCAECPNFIAVHPGASPPTRRYCSDACRMRAYRKRQKAEKDGG
jgi:hypothetical protein